MNAIQNSILYISLVFFLLVIVHISPVNCEFQSSWLIFDTRALALLSPEPFFPANNVESPQFSEHRA